MATIRIRKFGKEKYYYLEHRYKLNGKVKSISKYLGKKKPKNIEKLEEEITWATMRKIWNFQLAAISKNYNYKIGKIPKSELDKILDEFIINFIYNSSKIEGSRLSYKDTVGLFVHGATPRNKPLKDVQESEGYRKAFLSMMKHKSNITLDKIREWHAMIFKASELDIAGKIRLHQIIVTGSNVSFPHPEDLNRLLREFIFWYNKNENKLNPVEFAALAHLKFVTIHPFSDGNGRISRLLANFALHKAKHPMFNIKFGDRLAYYNSLKESQLWNNDKKFVRFFIKKYINQYKKFLKH